MNPIAVIARLTLACVIAVFLATANVRGGTDDSASEGHDKRVAEFDQSVGGYFTKHCVVCHGGEKQEGEFRIDTLSKLVGQHDTPLWAEVRERVSSGEMPPEDVESPPTADESAGIVEWITHKIDEGQTARMAARERVSFYRLSRDEYVHTIYDLLGVHVDATDPGGLSEDPEWMGFERIGSVLSLSASHVEKYLQTAETVLAEAYPEKPVEPLDLIKPAVPLNTVSEPYKSRLEAAGLMDKLRYDLWPQDQHRYSNPGRLPAPGLYEAQIRLSGLKPANGRAPRLKVYHTKLDRVLFEQDIVAPEDEPVTVRFQAHLPAGHQDIELVNDVPGPSNLPRSGRHGRKPFISIQDGRIPWQLKLTDEEGQPLYPFLIIDSAHWKGPLVTPAEQQLRDRYLPTDPEDETQWRDRLREFASNAFRRPARDDEVESVMRIVREELAAGSDLLTAVKTSMLAVLCSKSFLFLVEGSEGESRQALTDWELASRLSYFLWSTMPDHELRDAAASGRLSDPSELRHQVQRLLDDPRADRFADSFATQWLRLKKVGMFRPDEKLYPDYDTHLEKSMIGETKQFFREVLRSGGTLHELLDSDWTMLNDRLAMHYAMEPVHGDTFQRVRLSDDQPRGGLLTQAAILSLTSDGTRHRPVHRGVWLSETIFGKSPPPPPANVEPIEPTPVDAPKATLRMKLEAHQSSPQCASCHRKIDPLGFAFDHFDAIGRYRTQEVLAMGTGENPPVDASGVLPDGREFADATEFKRLLLDDIDRFGRTFIEKLATYGLRRTVTFEDESMIHQVATEAREQGYQVRSIVEAFVMSDLFRQR